MGSISVNTQAGFSIISYTGPGTGTAATLPHGLSKEPEFVITKCLNNTYDWLVYHKSAGTTHYTQLNHSNAFANDPATYNGPHDANVIKYGGTAVVANGNYIVYAWHSVPGYSAFGSYTGNGGIVDAGQTDGPFVYTGFKPAWVMTKATFTQSPNNDYNSWTIVDNVRSPHNPSTLGQGVWANSSTKEGYRTGGTAQLTTEPHIDLLSNGFKVRNSSYETGSSGIYIYMAFAEQPFTRNRAR